MNCQETIRGPKTGLRRPCPGTCNEYGECNQAKFHLWTAKSGWCATGACEGKKPVVDGVPQMTCRLWQRCPCKCHDTISQLLAPKKQQRVPYPDAYVKKEAFIVGWIKRYDAKQKLLNNPELRVRSICEDWAAGDRVTPCTASFIVSQTRDEKPLTLGEVERIMYDWLAKKTAFVGGEPMRFIKFV